MARTILVVDDEPTLRETLAENLEMEGFRVVTAADGRQALDRFRESQPDLVVLDLMLPELSGIEVCRVIRRESGVPILMLTARDSELDKVVGLELGADDYVTKPFGLRELLARVRALIRRSERQADAAAPTTIDLGRVHIDLAGHQILRDGLPLPVKPKAFELLTFLLRHPGQVFTRDQLLERVWGYDYAGETRTVDVHIHWLRGQIEGDACDTLVPPDGARRGLRLPATNRGAPLNRRAFVSPRLTPRFPSHMNARRPVWPRTDVAALDFHVTSNSSPESGFAVADPPPPFTSRGNPGPNRGFPFHRLSLPAPGGVFEV